MTMQYNRSKSTCIADFADFWNMGDDIDDSMTDGMGDDMIDDINYKWWQEWWHEIWMPNGVSTPLHPVVVALSSV